MSRAQTAYLSSEGGFTSFTFGKDVIRFRTSNHLQYYIDVKEWDKGYIVCTAQYDNSNQPEEEYVDLVPILENLYFDAEVFLAPIQNVEVRYDRPAA